MCVDDQVYLKPNVLAEPLVNQWYAWLYLISPATAAMFIANLHVKIMESFVASPQVHIAALKNPAMLGGPFINYDAGKVGQVKALLEQTRREQSELIALAESIKALDRLLLAEAKGYSLEPLYERAPENLRGYVELVYDLNNQPSLRVIEGLLYRSPYYKESLQSVSLSLIERDDRPFVLSTPRLEDDERLQFKLPFKHPGWDELFNMKLRAQPLKRVMDILEIDEPARARFSELFTTEPPPARKARADSALNVYYFGHACLLIESPQTTILCDPLISYHYPGATPRYTYADLPESIDYVLLTHNHQDHCMLETLLQLRARIKCLVTPKNNGGGLADPSLKLALQQIGFTNVVEIDEMESIEVADGAIRSVPFLGEHADMQVRSKTAYLVTLRGTSILCAADSNNIEPEIYRHIRAAVGKVDLLFLGMECDGAPLSWFYGPLLTRPLARQMDQSRRFNGSDYQRGIEIVNCLEPKEVYVYAMGEEPWLTHLTSIKYTEESRPIIESNRLVAKCRELGLVAEKLFGHKRISVK